MSIYSTNPIRFASVLTGAFLVGTSALLPTFAAEESRDDVIAACTEAARLMEDDDIDGALEEAKWCQEGIQQIKQSQTVAVFPDSVNGYEGGEVSNTGALGFVILGRDYVKGNKKLTLELSTGGLSGLGSIGQLMSAFSASGLGDGNKFRIQRRTVINSSNATSSNLLVHLKSGGMMTLKSTSVSGEEAVEFLKAFPIAELDDSITQ